MIVAWFRDCIYGNRSGTEGLEEQEMIRKLRERNITLEVIFSYFIYLLT